MEEPSPKKKVPGLISEEELAEIKALLPDEQFKAVKYLVYELSGYIKRGETEKVQEVRDRLQKKLEKLKEMPQFLMDLSRQYQRDNAHQFAKLRMQQQYIDRIQEKNEGPVKVTFPLGESKDAPSEKSEEIVVEKRTEMPVPKKPKIKRKPTQKTPKKQPVIKQKMQQEVVKIEPVRGVLTDAPPKDRTRKEIVHEITETAPVYDGVEGGFSPEETETVKSSPKATQKTPKKAKKPKPKPKAKNEDYYLNRKERVQDYIEKDKQKGHTISVKDMEDEQFEGI